MGNCKRRPGTGPSSTSGFFTTAGAVTPAPALDPGPGPRAHGQGRVARLTNPSAPAGQVQPGGVREGARAMPARQGRARAIRPGRSHSVQVGVGAERRGATRLRDLAVGRRLSVSTSGRCCGVRWRATFGRVPGLRPSAGRASPAGVAAVRDHDAAREQAGRVRGQGQHRRRDLVRLADAVHRGTTLTRTPRSARSQASDLVRW